MKKNLLTGLVAVLIAVACFAQKPYKVVFYNFENLFDTINDPGVKDEEFTPEGPKQWNSVKYGKKLANLERVLFDIAAEDKDFPVVIGVSEIENRSVLEDIVSTPKLRPANYSICHYDSPDLRGVDVAFLYRPDVFKLEGSENVPIRIESLPDFRTRGIVTMWGTIDGEPFLFMVSHWPSRLGGQQASAGGGNVWGDLLCLFAQCCFSIYVVVYKGLIGKYSPVTLMKWMFTYSAICTIPFSYSSVSSIDFATLPLSIYLNIAVVVLGGTFFAYLLIPIGQRALRPTVATMYNYVQPIIASIITVIVGLDTFGLMKSIAIVLVFLGVYIVTRSKSKAQMDAWKARAKADRPEQEPQS